MADDGAKERQRIIDRANRMVRQSKDLRKISDELLHESKDVRGAAGAAPKPRPNPKKR